ncbi:AAA family ATPase [Methylobacterium organophilum]|uniref:AAA family ATPase n=1 Tax=Methylobacterium organophilum TaxID=410 RepID=UPI001F144355|nr:AAA family ATPase [Methylobacterium organophilum]UMY18668.1 AAA family ATPase [Methylobacterium organophilum]
MRLAYVDVCGFRGYRRRLRLDFADAFTVIEGRNGVGKSTVCDAVEFALTGTISKYPEAKAGRETVADYIWWSGEGPAPEAHYVEVGFHDEDELFVVRREQIAAFDEASLSVVVDRLCDRAMRPSHPVAQLCKASIIRDEHIAALSLDLSETDRYALLRDAIGATDADEWVERGRQLVLLAKKRRDAANAEAEAAAREAAQAARRIDELRAAIAEEGTVASAVARLQALIGSTAPADSMAEVARMAIVERAQREDEMQSLRAGWVDYETAKASLADLVSAVADTQQTLVVRQLELEDLLQAMVDDAMQDFSERARDLAALADLGRHIGLNDGCCPLCASGVSHDAFARGIAAAEELASQLDARAVAREATLAQRRMAEADLAIATAAARRAANEAEAARQTVGAFEAQLRQAGFAPDRARSAVDAELERLGAELGRIREDLRVVETLRTNIALERAVAAEQAARTAYAKAQERLGVARLAETRAQALHDGARRAAGETLDQRLDRVLPLMTELFRRLRPHPLWSDIDYKIRGDVRRFLKLQVGDELNPQFIFSSGQRRATGLAFLLSVNLSLAWSRWRTILLDDPVQHVDDFRSVHLAEVIAQLVGAGRQIVCVVEDPALADHLCRRLPVTAPGKGARVTLGPDADGALALLDHRTLVPMAGAALVGEPTRAAG